MKTLLLTFGCSWTYGVGAGYEPGMSKNEYEQMAWDLNICNKLSWRGLISDKYNVFNRNFALGGSSNQAQERLAMQYVTSCTFQEDQNTFDKIVLLWGITSTSRNEMFSLQENKLEGFLPSAETKLSKFWLKLSYNHDFEVWVLAQKMRFWNLLFTGLNIKNLWFDTFNHHDYAIAQPGLDSVEDAYQQLYQQVKRPNWPSWQSFCEGSNNIDKEIYKEIIDTNLWPSWKYRRQSTHDLNLMFADQNPRDLMSLLCVKNGFNITDQQYHTSDWILDSNRVDYLVKNGILNPISFHPTKQGHVQISDIITDSVESLLS